MKIGKISPKNLIIIWLKPSNEETNFLTLSLNFDQIDAYDIVYVMYYKSVFDLLIYVYIIFMAR